MLCFRFIVEESRKLGLEVIDRCNLTVLLEPGQEDLVDFLAFNKVESLLLQTRLSCTIGQACPACVKI